MNLFRSFAGFIIALLTHSGFAQVQAEFQKSGIMLTADQIRLANITTQVVRTTTMTHDIVLSGRISFDQERSEVISARVPGRIERIFQKELGQRLVKGQPLYTIFSEQLLTLEREYLVALKRREDYPGHGAESLVLATEKKLSVAGMTGEQISGLALRRQPDSQITCYASADGVISELMISEGDYVSEGRSLFKTENLRRLWLETFFDAGESEMVRVGKEVSVRVSGYESIPLKGKIIFISPEYRPGSLKKMARIIIDNPSGKFLPGAQASVILSGSKQETFLLPADAVIHTSGGNLIWILESDGSFHPRFVKIGNESFEAVEITDGIKKEERVVVTGAYLLFAESILRKS